MGAAVGAAEGLLGMPGTEQAQLRGQLSAFPVLVVMLEGEDTPG